MMHFLYHQTHTHIVASGMPSGDVLLTFAVIYWFGGVQGGLAILQREHMLTHTHTHIIIIIIILQWEHMLTHTSSQVVLCWREVFFFYFIEVVEIF